MVDKGIKKSQRRKEKEEGTNGIYNGHKRMAPQLAPLKNRIDRNKYNAKSTRCTSTK